MSTSSHYQKKRLMAIAVHESAHGIFNYLLGNSVVELMICNSGGRCDYIEPPALNDPNSLDALRRGICVNMAGPLAENMYLAEALRSETSLATALIKMGFRKKSVKLFERFCPDDLLRMVIYPADCADMDSACASAMLLCDGNPFSLEYEDLLEGYESLVTNAVADLWPLILAVAEYLFRWRRLTGKDFLSVMALCENADFVKSQGYDPWRPFKKTKGPNHTNRLMKLGCSLISTDRKYASIVENVVRKVFPDPSEQWISAETSRDQRPHNMRKPSREESESIEKARHPRTRRQHARNYARFPSGNPRSLRVASCG